MNWILAVSNINWVDLFHYPHFGKPAPGQYMGPPVVFVVLDFALFLFLCYLFIWKELVRMAHEKNRTFHEEVNEAEALELEATRMHELVNTLEQTLEQQKQDIAEQVRQESEIEKEQILNKSRHYRDMRKNETFKQILIKKDLITRQIRDEILSESLLLLKKDLGNTVNPRAHAYLFQKGLDSTFEPMNFHEP